MVPLVCHPLDCRIVIINNRTAMISETTLNVAYYPIKLEDINLTSH